MSGYHTHAAATALLLAMLAVGCGGRATGARLRIDLRAGAFGPRTFTVRCSPARGSAPNPAAICAALAKHGYLLKAVRGQDHSCPAGPPVTHVAGTYRGHRVDATFSSCRYGQEQAAAEWSKLLHYGRR